MISRERGDTYAYKIRVRSKSTRELADLSGSVLLMSISSVREPTMEPVEFQISGNITDPINGEVEFAFSTSNANNLGKFHYDIQLTSAGEIRTVEKGVLIFSQDITK